jgi:Cyclic nucleotide-binding domain
LAGLNKSLKAGTVVFKAGDKADGMYLVRKGELAVYFEQGGKEVVLAKIPEGGMVGEMALFDRMPRSASVKASSDAEVTLISLDDFSKLMKQIPKWFVGLMTALSGRLRTTNERLKDVEAAAKSTGQSTGQNASGQSASSGTEKPFYTVLRQIHIMELVWHRDGSKEGKEWTVQRKIIEDELVGVFGENMAKLTLLIDLLIKEGVFAAKADSYKNVTLSLANRGSLKQFGAFLSTFSKDNPKLSVVPEQLMNILRIVTKLASKAPYDQFTVTTEEIIEAYKAISPAASSDNSGTVSEDVNQWKAYVGQFTTFGEGIKPVKTSSKSGLGLRVLKAELPALVKNLNVINKLSELKLA